MFSRPIEDCWCQLSKLFPVHGAGTTDIMVCSALNYVQLGRKSCVTCVLDQIALIFFRRRWTAW